MTAIDLSKQNCSYWYDPLAEITSQHQVVKKENRFDVYLQLYSQSRLVDSMSFFMQRSYTAEEHTEFVPVVDTIRSSDQLLIIHFTVPDTADNLLLLEYRHFFPFYFPIQLKYTNISYAGFRLQKTEEPSQTFRRYFEEGKYHSPELDSYDSLFVYRYKDSFLPADPPMSDNSGVSPTLEVDSVLVLSSENIQLDRAYFYFLQEDSSNAIGVSGYAGTRFFPKLTTLQDLIGPINYIGRKSEIQKIQSASDQKKAFDSFWLGLYPIKRNASDAIAAYYQMVSQANELFTNYKPGWKTDRGMIYIVLGKPSNVTRYDWREVWTYEDGVNFEFRIISNLFAPQQHYLMRKQDLANPWYAAVRSLRNNR